MNPNDNVAASVDVLNHRVVRRDRRIQRFVQVNAGLFEQIPAALIEEVRVRRRIQLHVGRPFVDQRLHFLSHNRRHILQHIVNRRVELVRHARPVAHDCMLHRRRRADFEPSRRMLLQKRRFVGREAAFLFELAADDVLKVAFFRFRGQIFPSPAPFEFHHWLSWHQSVHRFGNVGGKNIPAIFAVGKNLHPGSFLHLQRLEDRAVLYITDLGLTHASFPQRRPRFQQLRRPQ